MPDWAQIISDALDILKFDGAVQDTLAELREKWGAQVPALLDERFDAVGVQYMKLSHEKGAPAVVAVDEIGGKEDIKAVEYVRNCGCALAATAHGSSLEELKERAGFRELLEEKTFERLVFLSRKRECRGKVEVVYDSGFNRLYSGRIF